MLIELGVAGLSTSVIGLTYPAVKNAQIKGKQKANLRAAFEDGELYRKHNKIKISPKILNTKITEDKMTFIFSVPKGINPEKFIEKDYVIKQHFNDFIDLKMETKRGILKVYPKGLPKEFGYNYEKIPLKDYRLPIVCGQNLEGELLTYDMADSSTPHLLIAGETGSGKSSEIRSILTTLIKSKKPDELQLVLGDLKRSEFHLFKNLEHVEGVYHSANELRPSLKKIKKEMTKRGNKLDKAGVNSIDQLKEKTPYIIVCIDEVVLLKKENDIMDILEEISSIGRSLGVFIILSMQRPDSKLLDGKLKVNLTVRMGFKTADKTNSKIIGTPGSEKIEIPGRMTLKINSHLQEIQCPWLDNGKAKRLLETYRKDDVVSKHLIENNTLTSSEGVEQDEYSKIVELFKNE